jgi:hypothetical protein
MSASEKPLHIDIPVKLTDVKVVFSIASLAFEGGSAPQRQGQHRCHGENDAARSRRFREDYGMSRAPPPG